MSSLNRSDLERFKGRKVIFKRDDSFPDIKVRFVDNFEDFKIRPARDKSGADSKVIRYKEDSSFPDVKLKRVDCWQDIEIWFE